MSQFFGFIALHSSVQVKETARQMQESLTYFTGDGTGIYETDSVFICNKLLHNTPESVNTPLMCQNEQYVLAASCRLDNRAELAQKLSLNAVQSDHEYLLAAYSRYKQDCVKHLIGDFSFVIWDKQAQQLFMAKDHLGIKPLFYFRNDNILLFATSITAIKAVQSIDFALNELYIAKELKFFTPNFEDTFYQDIKRLKPAHFLCFDKQKRSLNEQLYWELTPIDLSDFKTEAALYEELRRRLMEAVLCRTRSIKNIGCQLSGGMDSSAIAVLLAHHSDKTKLHTYSFVLSDKTRPFSENAIDEQDTQNAIIEYADLKRENHHPIEDFYYKDVFEQMDITYRIMGGTGGFASASRETLPKTFPAAPGAEPGWSATPTLTSPCTACVCAGRLAAVNATCAVPLTAPVSAPPLCPCSIGVSPGPAPEPTGTRPLKSGNLKSDLPSPP
jgi:asparagine synthase (glutamine-hydrolysing)